MLFVKKFQILFEGASVFLPFFELSREAEVIIYAEILHMFTVFGSAHSCDFIVLIQSTVLKRVQKNHIAEVRFCYHFTILTYVN